MKHADYWNDLSRKLAADPDHLRREFSAQMASVACPVRPDDEAIPGRDDMDNVTELDHYRKLDPQPEPDPDPPGDAA